MTCPTCGNHIALTGWEPARDNVGRLTKRRRYGICTTCNTRQLEPRPWRTSTGGEPS